MSEYTHQINKIYKQAYRMINLARKGALRGVRHTFAQVGDIEQPKGGKVKEPLN